MTDSLDTVIVYATFPDMDTAVENARDLVAEGLVACANLLPGTRSIYRWEGEVEDAAEVVAILKTQAGRVDAVIAFVEDRHPYDTPAIVVLPIEKGSTRYLSWIRDETAIS